MTSQRPANSKKVAKVKEKISETREVVSSQMQFVERARNKVEKQEDEYLEEYLHIFKRLKVLIRIHEEKCRESKNARDVYALNVLYSQQREVIADIRAVTDMSHQVDQLVNDVLQPMTRSIGQNALNVFYQMRKLLTETTPPEKTQRALNELETLIMEQGKFIQQEYSVAEQKITTLLVG